MNINTLGPYHHTLRIHSHYNQIEPYSEYWRKMTLVSPFFHGSYEKRFTPREHHVASGAVYGYSAFGWNVMYSPKERIMVLDINYRRDTQTKQGVETVTYETIHGWARNCHPSENDVNELVPMVGMCCHLALHDRLSTHDEIIHDVSRQLEKYAH